jgi:hypothetical protein
MRKITVVIDETEIVVPTAWCQSKEAKDEIIGREVVFDHFDIEFIQRMEKILFKKANV